ncbi:MAG: type II glyceraldehyde-3-phosphate dehydrogenase [Bdellovibrionales bacterium]
MNQKRIRVAVNGYGVIGRRVADAVNVQPDMELVGVADVSSDWRVQAALTKGYRLFGVDNNVMAAMKEAGLEVSGALIDLLSKADVVVDCAPKKVGAANAKIYTEHKVKFIVQGGEKHETTGHSFVAEANYESAIGRDSTRVVSCNTTSIVRTLTALKRAGLLKKARGTLLRRATDPWESHKGGIMNTVLPESKIPSHQGPDAQSVDPSLDVITMAVMVPETIGHVHFWNVELTRNSTREEVLAAFGESSRIAFVRMDQGLTGINTIKELMADVGRSRDNLYEVAIWEDLVEVKGSELFYAYMVDNQAIVIPETIDAIRALSKSTKSATESMSRTNEALDLKRRFM